MLQEIKQEAELLLREYIGQDERQEDEKLFPDKRSNVDQKDNFDYFHRTLTNKYKDLIVGHLRLAEEIETLKEKIENYSFTLCSYEEQLSITQP